VAMKDVSQSVPTIPMLTGLMFLGAPVVFLVLLIVILRKLNEVLARLKGLLSNTP
jgi:hypothetical protein